MGYYYLLSLGAPLAYFKAAYGVLEDVNTYCHEGNITLQRRIGSNIAFSF